MNFFFFERNTNPTVLSYVTIFILLIFREQIINLLDRLVFFDRLFMSLSKNSYALFLIHTSIIFAFEKYLDLGNLSSQPKLAVVKMMGVIVVSVLLAPCFTTINSKLVKIQKTSKNNQENISNAD
jgi:peptidoglycan/LPS O-acetylase OafA/YrhL